MRRTLGNGMRQINLLLIPAAAFMMVLATPIVRLIFQRGQFDAQSTELVPMALFWFAWSLPFGGLNLLLTRTFFAVQRPWIPTRLAAMNIVVDIIVSIGLYKPLGIAGLVIGTVVANVVMTALQLHRLRTASTAASKAAQTTMITVRIAGRLGAAGGGLVGVSGLLDALLGASLVGSDHQRGRRWRRRALSTRGRCSRCGSPRPTRSARLIRRSRARLRSRRRQWPGEREPTRPSPNIDRRLLLTSQDCVSCLGGVTLPATWTGRPPERGRVAAAGPRRTHGRVGDPPDQEG